MNKTASVGLFVGLSFAFSVLGFLINILLQNQKWCSKVALALTGNHSWQALLLPNRPHGAAGEPLE